MLAFKMWSPFHYFMMIFPFVLTALLYIFVRNQRNIVKRRVGITLAIIMLITLVVRNVYFFLEHGMNPEVVPFQVCHFANIILLLAIVAKNKVWGTIGWCLNFPAGLVSVVFADGLVKHETLLHVHPIAYIVGHMLIVTLSLYLLLVGIIQINGKSLRQMYLFVAIGYLLSVPVNSWFTKLFARSELDSNYFYTFKPEAGTPLEDMFNLGESYTLVGVTFNPIYLLVLAAVGAVLLYVMYGLYKFAESSLSLSTPLDFTG